MEKFLKQTASYLLKKHGNNISEVTILFPNRRAGLFFQKYLSQITDKPVFSPQIVTISEFVSDLTGLKTDEPNSLIIELWKTYVGVTSSKETIDDFYYWGEMMLHDFNDIDKYLVDAEKLFKNILSLKEIDFGFDFLTEEQLDFLSVFWNNIINSKDSKNKQSFLNIWYKLLDIYSNFKQGLLAENRSYEGMLYREMAEKLNVFPKIKNKRHAIIGFNALNKCEEKLFNYLKTNYQTDFFWDYDIYYLSKNFHEASLFIKSNLANFPMPDDFKIDFDNFSKIRNIDVVAVPGFSGQASYASRWLSDIKVNINSGFDNTSVVLCDESMLLPMLNNLPDGIEDINITMGFPVKSSPVYGLIKGLVDIDKNCRKDSEGDNIVYFRNVLAMLNYSLIIESAGSEEIEKYNTRIQKENKIYVKNTDFNENDFLKQVFTIPGTTAEVRSYLQTILMHIFSAVPENDSIIKESIYQVYLSINRLYDSVFKPSEEIIISKKLFYQLLIKQLDRLTIPFEGEPLSGVQLMGFLETRCIDFNNLILLSFNDERLPGKTHQHSFIPYSLRKGFGLPVIEQKNAMYSYYFYRLIQRAENITLVYDSRTEGMFRGEVSRFVIQLKYEADFMKINELHAVFDCNSSGGRQIEIKKDSNTSKMVVKHLTSKVISPTALNAYLTCKLKFYFRYIEEIKEPDELIEEIDQSLFGKIAHTIIEELYKPFEGKEIVVNDIKNFIENENILDEYYNKALIKDFFKGNEFDLNGKNLLVFEIIKKYIKKILYYDMNLTPFKLMGVEKKVKTEIYAGSGERKIKIFIGGTIDRIDIVNGYMRVIDYKTGRSKNEVKSIESLFFPEYKDRNSAAFQTMVYSLCIYDELKPKEPIITGVYGVTDIFAQNFQPLFQLNDDILILQPNAEELKYQIKNLLEEIINPDIPFSQSKKPDSCRFCEYNVFCKR